MAGDVDLKRYESFREQKTRRDLLACLRRIGRHLAGGGVCLITERRFDPSAYSNGRRTFGWSEPRPHPETAELVCRRGEIRLSRDHKRVRGTFIYKTAHADGRETIQRCPWSGPLLSPGEHLRLFARAGFDTQTFVDYKEVADDGAGPILCFVCEVANRPGS